MGITVGALVGLLHGLKGMVMVSGYPCELYDRLYGDWLKMETSARSMLNVKRIECIWLSPRIGSSQLRFEEE